MEEKHGRKQNYSSLSGSTYQTSCSVPLLSGTKISADNLQCFYFNVTHLQWAQCCRGKCMSKQQNNEIITEEKEVPPRLLSIKSKIHTGNVGTDNLVSHLEIDYRIICSYCLKFLCWITQVHFLLMAAGTALIKVLGYWCGIFLTSFCFINLLILMY